MTRVLEIVETQIASRLAQAGIIALGAPEDPEEAEEAGNALVRGGVTCMELAAPTLALIRAARRVDGLLVGAGNLLRGEQVESAVRAGAHFATAPATNMEVVHACREVDCPFLPGVATPSEIERVALLGVRVVRLFPAAPLGGVEFVRAVAAIYPDVRFVPSGGIGPEAVRAYLNEPAVLAVGVGGVLREELLRSRGHSRIEWLAREAARVVPICTGWPVRRPAWVRGLTVMPRPGLPASLPFTLSHVSSSSSGASTGGLTFTLYAVPSAAQQLT